MKIGWSFFLSMIFLISGLILGISGFFGLMIPMILCGSYFTIKWATLMAEISDAP